MIRYFGPLNQYSKLWHGSMSFDAMYIGFTFDHHHHWRTLDHLLISVDRFATLVISLTFAPYLVLDNGRVFPEVLTVSHYSCLWFKSAGSSCC